MALCAFGLRMWAMHTLRDSFSRSLVSLENQALVDSGPYAYLRHPGYAANGVLFVACSLVITANPPVAAACCGTFAFSWHRRMVAEEKMLCRAMAGYKDYSVRVRFRLVPFLY